ncbi:MAG: GNAT family N-acetyltransferase [Acidobacteriota bacterium]
MGIPKTAVLRFAETDDDRAAAWRLLYELYVEDQGLFVDVADHERRWLCDAYDADSHVVLAEIDGELVGTARMTFGFDTQLTDTTRQAYDVDSFADAVDEERIAVITRLVVHTAYRGGRGLALQLFDACFALAARRGSDLILGSCELHLINSYRTLGFQPFGELDNHPTNGALVRIAVVVGDREHLERIDSPMLPALGQRTAPCGNLDAIRARLADRPAILSATRLGPDAFRQETSRHLEAVATPTRFDQLDADETDRLLHKAHLLRCREGDALFYAGHTSRTVYVLLDGAVDLLDPALGTRRLDRPGTLLGEVALTGATRRPNSAVAAAGGARLLALDDRSLRRRLAAHDALAAKILTWIAASLGRQLVRFADAASLPVSPVEAASSEIARTTSQRRKCAAERPGGRIARRAASRPHRRARRATRSLRSDSIVAPSTLRSQETTRAPSSRR